LTLSDDDVPHNLQVSSFRLHLNFSCKRHFISEFGPVYIFILFVLQPTNAQIYITIFSLYIMFIPTCFNSSVSSSGSLKNLYFAMVHQLLELQLLKLQLHKIIRWKLFGCHWVIQYSLCNITISFERSVFMWLHIQSLVTVLCVLVWHVTSQIP
jgi:hypothetical protein